MVPAQCFGLKYLLKGHNSFEFKATYCTSLRWPLGAPVAIFCVNSELLSYIPGNPIFIPGTGVGLQERAVRLDFYLLKMKPSVM